MTPSVGFSWYARWPARYVLAQVYQAEVAYAQSTGTYTCSIWKLLKGGFCTLDNGCYASSLFKVATVYARIFNLHIVVDNMATSCVRYASSSTPANYTGGPCFTASVDMKMPFWTQLHSRIRGSIREDRFLDVHVSGTRGRECLRI